MDSLKIVNLAREMSHLKAKIDELSDEKKDLQKKYDELRFSKIPDALDEEGIENIRIAGVGTVYLTDDLNASMVDKVSAMAWLEENGYGDLIKPYVFPQTLKAFAKEQVKGGVELPESLFKVTPFTRAAIKPGS